MLLMVFKILKTKMSDMSYSWGTCIEDYWHSDVSIACTWTLLYSIVLWGVKSVVKHNYPVSYEIV